MLSVIIPTLNEAPNIQITLQQIILALQDSPETYEILVVDDGSSDNTAALAGEILSGRGTVIRRQRPRGLAVSVMEGLKQAQGDIVAVMDADGSHPAQVLPELIKAVRDGYDIAIAGRYGPGGCSKDNGARVFISRAACALAGGLLKLKVKDGMSGYFCFKKAIIRDVPLEPRGFKIGLEILVKAGKSRCCEIPYIFLKRQRGASKFSFKPAFDFLLQVAALKAYQNR